MRRDRAKHFRVVRTSLFVGLSAFAVPACQHYDAADTPQGEQALHRVAAPVSVPPPARALPA